MTAFPSLPTPSRSLTSAAVRSTSPYPHVHILTRLSPISSSFPLLEFYRPPPVSPASDGLLLSKLINDAVPDTIDERVLNKPGGKTRAPSAMPSAKSSRGATLNSFQMTENNNLVITSAKSLGLSVVNIGATDLNEGREHLILGLIWQVIRKGLLGKIDIKLHPELYRLLDEDETLEQFLRLPPDQILLRWFNYHLKAANWGRRCVSFPFSSSCLPLSSTDYCFERLQRHQLLKGRFGRRELHGPP